MTREILAWTLKTNNNKKPFSLASHRNKTIQSCKKGFYINERLEIVFLSKDVHTEIIYVEGKTR